MIKLLKYKKPIRNIMIQKIVLAHHIIFDILLLT